MYSFRKSKKGFTLIELMVVVAIIGVLALLGLRLYSTQQTKAKMAMMKANAGTVQVAIQTELVDNPTLSEADAVGLEDLSVLKNPFVPSGAAVVQIADATAGAVAVSRPSEGYFTVTPYDGDGEAMDYVLTAQR